MATRWKKAPSGLITPHFSWHEAACRHCGRIPGDMSVRLTAEWMERVRSEVYHGRVLHVNSWARCPEHNRAVGGASQSYHMLGWAVDITARGLSPYQTWVLAKAYQGQGKLIGGLGKYVSFTHVDRGPSRRWNGP